MLGGWTDHLWDWGEVFRRRLFRAHVALPRRWGEYYDRLVRTLIYGAGQAAQASNYSY